MVKKIGSKIENSGDKGKGEEVMITLKMKAMLAQWLKDAALSVDNLCKKLTQTRLTKRQIQDGVTRKGLKAELADEIGWQTWCQAQACACEKAEQEKVESRASLFSRGECDSSSACPVPPEESELLQESTLRDRQQYE